VPDNVGDRARRIVASLFRRSPGLAYGGLRGAADDATRVYEAGHITVTIGPGETRGSLLGLVVAVDSPPEALNGAAARLIGPNGAAVVAQIDDLGNFEVFDLAPGVYTVEVELPDGLLVIEELRVD
jgi:hypothetical protein